MLYHVDFVIEICVCEEEKRERDVQREGEKRKYVVLNQGKLINMHNCKQHSEDRYTVLSMI